MAIKGKGKAKRRGVAAAPKPMYVQPKRPLLARRGFWITVAVIIVLGATAGFLTGFMIERHNNHEKAVRATETGIVLTFGDKVTQALLTVGQPQSNVFQVLPDMTSDVSDLQLGQLTSANAIKHADGYVKDLKAAGTTLRAIDTAALIEGHADLLPLSDSQNLMLNGLTVYQQAAESLKLSAQASGTLRKDLIDHTSTLIATAQNVFTEGYQKLTNLRTEFGLLGPIQPPPAAPTPGPVTSTTITTGGKSGKTGGKSGGNKHHK